MIAAISRFYFFSVIIILMGASTSHGQICVNKYTSLKYKGSTYDTLTCSIVNANNEIISAGTLRDYNNAGHVAKYTAKGTVVWSYQYKLDYFDFYRNIFFKAIHFNDIIATHDGGYLLIGNVDQVLSPYGNPPPVKKHGLLAKIDRFGKVLWNKTISTAYGEVSFAGSVQTSDGGCIAYLATDNGVKKKANDQTYGRVIRMDANGDIKWATLLFTYLYDAGGLGVENKRALTQASNGNIIVGDVVHKSGFNYGYMTEEGNLHFMELDYATGKVNWETSYEYPVPPGDRYYSPDILNVTELPGGKFSFITSLYVNTGTLVKKGANIITSSKGVVEDVIAYAPADDKPCRITHVDVDRNTGNRALLFDKGGKATLASVTADGQIAWQQGYTDDGGSFPANCFSAGKSGFNIFMSNNNSFYTRLLMTDAEGVIDCRNTKADLVAASVPTALIPGGATTVTNIEFDNFLDYAYPFRRSDDYPLAKMIECQETLACCVDITDNSINKISICEGSGFMLPDSSIAKDSGTYDIIYKTALGCDSIVYYNVTVDKNISALSLGPDTCLMQQTSLVLKATPGYDKYYWLNELTAGKPDYKVNAPGNYWVTVSNICGTKTDSIIIYDQCDYPVDMPTAFTPNSDGLNDIYRVPALNKNKLIRLSIYNRWGKLIFETTDKQSGWDGNLNGQPLTSDTFVYYVEMESISGNRLTGKGTFVLIR
jgi:gliding motility-associated-like protein